MADAAENKNGKKPAAMKEVKLVKPKQQSKKVIQKKGGSKKAGKSEK